MPRSDRRRDALILAGILLVAAAFRLVNLPVRGEFDDDQGAHMLAMLQWVRDGTVPLLGPTSSLGEAHHGVVYYWLLAPSAFLTDADPIAATLTLAVIGIVGVAAVWSLGRIIGGPLAGHASGLLAAVSPTAVAASIFIWNPNLVMPGAAIASTGAWQARRSGQMRWWVVSAFGALVMVHGHLVSAVFLVPLAALLVLDLRDRRRDGLPVARVVVGVAAVFVVGYLPLLAYELGHGFAETRAILAYLNGGGGGDGTGTNVVVRLLLVAIRTLSAPITGSLAVAAGSVVIVVAIGVAVALGGRLRFAEGVERQAMRWIAATLAGSLVALAVVAPSLAVVVPGLPNDHYHAFLDPLVFAIVGASAAALTRLLGPAARVAPAATIALAALIGFPAQPPITSSDGGWPSVQAAARQIEKDIGQVGVAVVPLPSAKTGEALVFPLERDGATVAEATIPGPTTLIVVCDPRFEQVIGAPCGGPAEDPVAAAHGFGGAVDRWTQDARRAVSVYTRQCVAAPC